MVSIDLHMDEKLRMLTRWYPGVLRQAGCQMQQRYQR